MSDIKKLAYDLDQIAEAFHLERVPAHSALDNWMKANYALNASETEIIDTLHVETLESGDYWNEEELKIEFVGTVFLVAKVKVPGQIRVFFERSMSATINKYKLAVIADCIVATPKQFSGPKNPYFFLQEFKKGIGEKNDPEAQMLTAMLIAQHVNDDKKPIYGGFLVGSDWRFTILSGKQYAVSRKYDAMQKPDLQQIVYNIRMLKTLIETR